MSNTQMYQQKKNKQIITQHNNSVINIQFVLFERRINIFVMSIRKVLMRTPYGFISVVIQIVSSSQSMCCNDFNQLSDSRGISYIFVAFLFSRR